MGELQQRESMSMPNHKTSHLGSFANRLASCNVDDIDKLLGNYGNWGNTTEKSGAFSLPCHLLNN